MLHSTLGQCKKISDCSYTGQTFLQKRNINNVNQNKTAGEDSKQGEEDETEEKEKDGMGGLFRRDDTKTAVF